MKITSAKVGVFETVCFFLILLLSNANMTAQQIKTYTGIVTDSKLVPVPGANVVIKGTKNSAVTDFDGKFSIQANAGEILSFNFIGFKSKEVKLSSSTSLTIALEDEIATLNEVVVIGYGTLDKKEVTSAVSHVSGDELIENGPTNPIQSLAGKVAGLSITNTGGTDPNAGPSIQLRGVTSRAAGSGPLIVVDGVIGGNLYNINKNDIKSFDVLKDGSASAMYGTQGSNGVIIITTKTGKKGMAQASYNAYTSFSVPTNQLKSLSAEEFVAAGRGIDYGGRTNWQKEVLKGSGIAKSHSLSLSGGTDFMTYRASLDYRDAEGMDLRSARKEYGGRIALTHIGKNDKYSVTVNFAPRFIKRDNSDTNAITKALLLNPTYPVYGNTPSGYTDIPPGSDGNFNPVELLNLDQSGTEEKYLEMNSTFKLNLSDHLNTQVTLAQNNTDDFSYYFRPSVSNLAIRSGYKGEANRGYTTNTQQNADWLVNYNNRFGKHSVKALGGYTYQYNVRSGMSAENKDFTSDALTYNNLGDGTFQSEEEGRTGFGSHKQDSRLIAFFGRLNYSFDDKYLLSASLRHEGSSKFGENNKWGNFPGVSVGWHLNKESFLKDVSWINDLKLRADYGETGNQAFDNYKSLSIYGGFGQYLYDGKYYTVWGPGNNPNANLKWEVGKNINVGFDFGFYDNRITGSLNYYNRKQEDILGDYRSPVPPNVFSTTFVNVGSMRNEGFELDLSYDVIRSNNLNYNVTFVGSSNNNKFLSFSNEIFEGQSHTDLVYLPSPGTPGPAQRLEEGRRIGEFYMWKFAGVDQFGNMLILSKNNEIIHQNEATEDDKRFVGNGLPKYFASLNQKVTYKNWDLAVFLRGAFDYDIFNIHDFYYGLDSSPENENVLSSAYGKNQLIKGDKVLTDYFLEKGDYIKLDAVTIGYTLKMSSYFDSLRLYATGSNLATFTSFSGDPEMYPVNGLTPGITGSKSYYPAAATYLVGINLNF
ncbi:SusC/RagA family TonB-linked outer membrane protein [Flavobacterium aestuarii]|uniref:SusC/RagA family TonB-linked outer membrane protein n=1 Tax=Flavobacterium aestuarii TaxID=3149227 RepID=UPI0032B31930